MIGANSDAGSYVHGESSAESEPEDDALANYHRNKTKKMTQLKPDQLMGDSIAATKRLRELEAADDSDGSKPQDIALSKFLHRQEVKSCRMKVGACIPEVDEFLRTDGFTLLQKENNIHKAAVKTAVVAPASPAAGKDDTLTPRKALACIDNLMNF